MPTSRSNQTASKYSSPGLWELLGRLSRAHWPVAIRGDRDWGTQANMARAEQEGLAYLFKLRMTKGVKKIVERLMRGAAWSEAGQGWQGAETALRLQGLESRTSHHRVAPPSQSRSGHRR